MSQNEITVDMLKAMAGEKARQDDAFRAELLSNPRAAVEKLFGQELPAQITIKAVEEAPDTYIIGVPSKPTVGAHGELSDSDLEAVAGGSKSGAKAFFTAVDSAIVDGGAGGQAGALAQRYDRGPKTC